MLSKLKHEADNVLKHRKQQEWYDVRITLHDNSIFDDAIQGKNYVDALKNAQINWSSAEKIELI